MFKNGRDFEEAVFGKQNGIIDNNPCFVGGIRYLLQNNQEQYPEAFLGQAIYSQLGRELSCQDIDVRGLRFISTLETKIDYFHHTDGIVYVPSLDPYLVTIDLFHIDQEILSQLKEYWIDSFSGDIYSWSDFQSDLFRYKKGMAEYARTHPYLFHQSYRLSRLFRNIPLEKQIDYRQFYQQGRPENHFVMTPCMVRDYESRRFFAKMVSVYLAEVAATLPAIYSS